MFVFHSPEEGECILVVMFNTLYRLGESVSIDWEEPNLYACAAKDGECAAVVLTHFNDTDKTEPKEITLDLSGYGGEHGAELEIYLLDEDHDLTLRESIVFYGNRLVWKTQVPNFTSYLLKLKRL
ncbi:MAG: hypothetical protein IJW99_10025 [Clostridia bacterium]|nr:hypothetical protein [Clostridia bacterium]